MQRIQDIYCTGIEIETDFKMRTSMVIKNLHAKKQYKPLPVHMIHSKGIFIETQFSLGGMTTNVSCISRDRILRLRLTSEGHKNCYIVREVLMEYAPVSERPRKEDPRR